MAWSVFALTLVLGVSCGRPPVTNRAKLERQEAVERHQAQIDPPAINLPKQLVSCKCLQPPPPPSHFTPFAPQPTRATNPRDLRDPRLFQAPRFNALLLCLEHRHYGGYDFDAVPKFDLEGLHFLSSRQALEDVAAFRVYAAEVAMPEPPPLPDNVAARSDADNTAAAEYPPLPPPGTAAAATDPVNGDAAEYPPLPPPDTATAVKDLDNMAAVENPSPTPALEDDAPPLPAPLEPPQSHDILGDGAREMQLPKRPVQTGQLSEMQKINLDIATAAVTGRLEDNPFIQGLLIKCVRTLEKSERGIVSLRGRASNAVSSTEQSLVADAALTLCMSAGGNAALAKQLGQNTKPPQAVLDDLHSMSLPCPALALMSSNIEILEENLKIVDQLCWRDAEMPTQRLFLAIDHTYLQRCFQQIKLNNRCGIVGGCWWADYEQNAFIHIEDLPPDCLKQKKACLRNNVAGWAGMGVITSNQYNNNRCSITSCNIRLLCGNLSLMSEALPSELDALVELDRFQQEAWCLSRPRGLPIRIDVAGYVLCDAPDLLVNAQNNPAVGLVEALKALVRVQEMMQAADLYTLPSFGSGGPVKAYVHLRELALLAREAGVSTQDFAHCEMKASQRMIMVNTGSIPYRSFGPTPTSSTTTRPEVAAAGAVADWLGAF
eukprot:g27671.t1